MAFAEYIETKTGSWAYERENYESLAATAKLIAYSAMSDGDLPEEVNPTGWTVIEDQGNQGACRGHSLSSCIEQCHLREGGELLQLSRAAAYYETQRIDRISGDRGSTIDGGCKLAEQIGIPLERDWPYPSRYNPARPSGYEQMVKYKTSGHSPINSADDAIKHLAFHGPVDIGIIWGGEMDQQASRNGIVSSYTGRGGGGHAIMIGGYTSKGWNGEALSDIHLLLYNSWSQRWGRNGVVLVTKRAFDAMCGHQYNVLVGHFGAPHPEIKDIEYDR